MLQKVILKLDLADDKTKQKAMKKVSGLSGLESISLYQKDKKLTVTGNIDPIDVVAKLRKICNTEIISVGPAKEPEKKKEGPKKEEPKKAADDKKKAEEAAAQLLKAYQQAYYQNPYYYQYHHVQPPAAVAPPLPYPAYYQRSAEEDPNGCVIS